MWRREIHEPRRGDRCGLPPRGMDRGRAHRPPGAGIEDLLGVEDLGAVEGSWIPRDHAGEATSRIKLAGLRRAASSRGRGDGLIGQRRIGAPPRNADAPMDLRGDDIGGSEGSREPVGAGRRVKAAHAAFRRGVRGGGCADTVSGDDCRRVDRVGVDVGDPTTQRGDARAGLPARLDHRGVARDRTASGVVRRVPGHQQLCAVPAQRDVGWRRRDPRRRP